MINVWCAAVGQSTIEFLGIEIAPNIQNEREYAWKSVAKSNQSPEASDMMN